jgi:hypothetical protein
MTLPKILVAAPQHISKLYCWNDWATNVENFTYSNFDVFLSDNSSNKEFKPYVDARGFIYHHVKENPKGKLFTINDSHEACRKYALENGYDALLHLETDVFPPIDVIERLLAHNKGVVAASYDIRTGKNRQAMAQLIEDVNGFTKGLRTTDFVAENEPLFFDGAVKQVYHAGLGCILIRKNILEQFEFFVRDNANNTDVIFANVMTQKQLPIFIDTSIQCVHKNMSWANLEMENL